MVFQMSVIILFLLQSRTRNVLAIFNIALISFKKQPYFFFGLQTLGPSARLDHFNPNFPITFFNFLKKLSS